MAMEIVSATLAHAPEIAAIYSHHVLHGTATFEIDPPEGAEMAARLGRILGAGAPWLVACDERGLLGYAYAAQFRERPAYRFSCEDSVYVRHDRQGEGVGKALLTELIKRVQSCGFRQMFGVIGGAEPASVALHAACGFVEVGRMRAIGRKHGRWLDTLYMQRALGDADHTPPLGEPG